MLSTVGPRASRARTGYVSDGTVCITKRWLAIFLSAYLIYSPLNQSPYKERPQTVPIDLDNPRDPFVHVHVCVHCGSAFGRDEFGDRAQTTGIYLCPKCGVESPLNIEIRAADTLGNASGNAD